jgi:hypothetical protein
MPTDYDDEDDDEGRARGRLLSLADYDRPFATGSGYVSTTGSPVVFHEFFTLPASWQNGMRL